MVERWKWNSGGSDDFHLSTISTYPGRRARARGAAMSTWTTRLPPERTRLFGVEEMHVAWLLPRGYPGRGPVVCLTIPECELKFVSGVEIAGAMIVYTFDRPRPSLARWIKDACKIASDENAVLFITADTVEHSSSPCGSPRNACRITNAPRWNA